MNDGIAVETIKGAYRVRKEQRRRDVSYGSFSRAEHAARRLVTTGQGDAFVITQEVARVSASAEAFVIRPVSEKSLGEMIADAERNGAVFGAPENIDD